MEGDNVCSIVYFDLSHFSNVYFSCLIELVMHSSYRLSINTLFFLM